MSETPTRTMPAVVVPPPPALDDQAKVAAAKGVSPTGKPRMKPQQVPWALGLLVGLNMGLGACALKAPDPTVRLLCEFGAITASGIVATVSPGLRKKP